MTPHEIEALTAADLAAELGWEIHGLRRAEFLIRVRDMTVKALQESPQDALEVPERIAAKIASTLWAREAHTLALILLRAYTPEDP